MKKLFTFVIALVAVVTLSNKTQAQSFQKGSTILGAGLQFESGITPIALSAEFGIQDAIGVGPKVSYASKSELGYKTTSLFIGAIGNYHLSEVLNLNNDKIDLYAGVSPGIFKATVDLGAFGTASASDFGMLGQLGTRYYITDKIGAYAQLNVGIIKASGSNFELGVAFKLK